MTQEELKKESAEYADSCENVVTSGDWQEIDLAYRVGYQAALIAFAKEVELYSDQKAIFQEIVDTPQEY